MNPSRFAIAMYAFGGVSGLISVALAAFTSHGLLQMAPTGDQAVTWFKIGTGFQMDHVLGLIAITAISEHLAFGRPRQLMRIAAGLLAAGSLLFPAALYSLSFHGPSFFAPWGGFAAMGGWLLFAIGAFMTLKNRSAT